MVRREKSNYVIQSVAHALDVLEQFAGEAEELGVTDLSKRLKLHKNNVFRLLATLESRGYIEQNRATENYRLGIRCLQLGQSYVQHMGLLRQARPLVVLGLERQVHLAGRRRVQRQRLDGGRQGVPGVRDRGRPAGAASRVAAEVHRADGR